jgi:hypothetical protein
MQPAEAPPELNRSHYSPLNSELPPHRSRRSALPIPLQKRNAMPCLPLHGNANPRFERIVQVATRGVAVSMRPTFPDTGNTGCSREPLPANLDQGVVRAASLWRGNRAGTLSVPDRASGVATAAEAVSSNRHPLLRETLRRPVIDRTPAMVVSVSRPREKSASTFWAGSAEQTTKMEFHQDCNLARLTLHRGTLTSVLSAQTGQRV